jgi:flagellar hook-basal body complex protein FliE
MKPISTEQILSQIRALNADLQGQKTSDLPAAHGPSFGDLLQTTISSVSETQQTAKDMAVAYETGKSDASLVEVMVALQESDLSFRAATEVRNKLVSAYQEIMNMPV